MIRAVRCNNPGFKTVRFEPGMNVILADRTKESTRKDSRNGLGKTTLVEIIHFCLGAEAKKGKGLLREEMAGWTFTIDLDLPDCHISVHRSTGQPRVVLVDGWSGNNKLLGTLWTLSANETREFPIREWNELLGKAVFDLPSRGIEDKYTPTFRSLFSYFVRRGRDAFSTPFEHHRKQREWDKQVNNALLLGLEWEYASRWQILKEEEKILKQLKQASGTGIVQGLVGTVGELEAARVRIEEQLTADSAALASFRVHPQYRKIEEEATRITTELHSRNNENLRDRRMLELCQTSVRSEQSADHSALVELYEAAGTELPGMVVRRLDEVRRFHEQVLENRRSFLQEEIERLTAAITGREAEMHRMSDERASLLEILRTHGALEEYTTLQQQLLRATAELEDVRRRLDAARKFKNGASALRIQRESLAQETRADYDERGSLRERAVSLFNSNTQVLYEVGGKLILDVGRNGFEFDVEIERSSSQGFEQMKVFCYDLMLAELWAKKPIGPRFLVHDSPIFDGVDSRQVSAALQLAARKAEEFGFQYICCLNSDAVPRSDFEPGFDIDGFVRLRLTDATEDGGLLGARF